MFFFMKPLIHGLLKLRFCSRLAYQTQDAFLFGGGGILVSALWICAAPNGMVFCHLGQK